MQITLEDYKTALSQVFHVSLVCTQTFPSVVQESGSEAEEETKKKKPKIVQESGSEAEEESQETKKKKPKIVSDSDEDVEADS